ncbi:hypothetical protein IJG14_02715 [bacterium]|nr:hypothetical protein [bacterium]
MIISDFLKSLRGCQHKKVNINTKGAYCPDCGEYIIVKWYLVRCSCCGVKRIAYLDFNDNVKPEDRYCPNCGNEEITIEAIEKINFVDINFAVHKKEIVKIEHGMTTQVWTEKEERQLIATKAKK